MNASLRTHAFLAIALAGTLLLGACGRRAPAAPPPAPAATAPTASASAHAPVAGAGAAITARPAPARLASAAPAPAASAATAALSVTRLTLGDSIGSNLEITTASNSFASDSKTLYASVDTRGSSSDATLNARWRYLEGKGQLIGDVTQSIATDGPAVTTFKLENPDLWPEGKYQVEIRLDGKPVATQAFLIHKR
ncbi:MAG: hypothetical protein KGM46_04295 [Pseudomonadota bacterium]|nr:hypothetical protein [Pseudomonadota bacterium]